MDAAVKEDAARRRRKANEEAVGVDGIFRDAADREDLPQFAGVDPALGFRVGRIEAPHEADHHHLTGVIGGGGDRPVAIARIERQRFLAEYVLARAD